MYFFFPFLIRVAAKCEVLIHSRLNLLQSKLTTRYLELVNSIYTEPADEKLMGKLIFNFMITTPFEKNERKKVNFEWKIWKWKQRYSLNARECCKEENRARILYYYQANHYKNAKMNHRNFLNKFASLSFLRTYIYLQRNFFYPFSWVLFLFSIF